MQKLFFGDADFYFFLRPIATVSDHSKVISSIVFSSKLIYHVSYMFEVHCLYILIPIAFEIIAIVYGKSHLGFI